MMIWKMMMKMALTMKERRAKVIFVTFSVFIIIYIYPEVNGVVNSIH